MPSPQSMVDYPLIGQGFEKIWDVHILQMAVVSDDDRQRHVRKRIVSDLEDHAGLTLPYSNLLETAC